MIDIETYLRFVLALAAVLGLIGGAAWLFKRYGVERHLERKGTAAKRLGVVEVKTVDPRHKLLLLRRDRVEHLVLLGPGQALLVEQNIRPAGASAEGGGAAGTDEGLLRLHRGSGSGRA